MHEAAAAPQTMQNGSRQSLADAHENLVSAAEHHMVDESYRGGTHSVPRSRLCVELARERPLKKMPVIFFDEAHRL